MIAAALTGFVTSLSLILAIGAQNAFVLRQGLLRQHVGALVLFCGASDALLIAAGVAGFGAVTARFPGLPTFMTWAGAAFLIVYGALRLRAAWAGTGAMATGQDAPSLGRTLAVAAAFTWANPHVYLDTLGLIGAISTRFDGPSKVAFGAGATTASFVFFACLGFGARLLAPVMARPAAWRVLDGLIGMTMWALATGLLLHG